MESLSVTHPALVLLNRLCKTSSKAVLESTETQKNSSEGLQIHISQSCWIVTTVTHTHTHSQKHAHMPTQNDGRERDGFWGGTKPGNGVFR